MTIEQQVSLSDTASFLWQVVSSIMSHPMTNSLWVTDASFLWQAVSSTISHPMTNRMWVTLLCFFARQSHWLSVSFHDQQSVSDKTALVLFQVDSWIMSHPMTNSMWVTLLYLKFARQSHQSCFIPWPIVGEWHCFITIINCVWSHNQQEVSDTALFLYQSVSSIMSHPMTNSEWVTLLYFFARQSYQSCFISWPTASEWHCLI